MVWYHPSKQLFITLFPNIIHKCDELQSRSVSFDNQYFTLIATQKELNNTAVSATAIGVDEITDKEAVRNGHFVVCTETLKVGCLWNGGANFGRNRKGSRL